MLSTIFQLISLLQLNVPSIVKTGNAIFQYKIWNGLKLKKSTEWKGLHDSVHNSITVFYYFYSTMANTVVNGIHVKGMI